MHETPPLDRISPTDVQAYQSDGSISSIHHSQELAEVSCHGAHRASQDLETTSNSHHVSDHFQTIRCGDKRDFEDRTSDDEVSRFSGTNYEKLSKLLQTGDLTKLDPRGTAEALEHPAYSYACDCMVYAASVQS